MLNMVIFLILNTTLLTLILVSGFCTVRKWTVVSKFRSKLLPPFPGSKSESTEIV